MRALFDLIHDRSLIASTPTGLMTAEQRARLEGLTRLLRGERTEPSSPKAPRHRRQMPRVPITLPMLLTKHDPGGTETVYEAVLWDVSGDGLGVVALGMRARRGAEVVATVEVDGMRYTFPARVAHVEADGRLGLRFLTSDDGAPTRERASSSRHSQTRIRGARDKRRTA